ncbi:MAG: rhodanese-like domain-containing protein [Protaetiibacter sp.]
MSEPLVGALELASELDGVAPPAVLDASLVLHTAAFDGDYRKESGRGRWLEAHLPRSQHVDVSVQFSDPDAALHYTHPEPAALAAALAAIGVAEGRRVVVYDTTGTLWAARLWYLLRWIGVDVRVLDGGLDAWTAAGLPVRRGEEPADSPVPAWPASEVREAWIDQRELLARADDDIRPLVCGLPAAQFTGSAPTRYSRRGRIPGSVNVSSRDLFGPDGRLLPPAELLAAHLAAGIEPGESEVLLYCGGGISASANALALAVLGVDAVRIYDGSLEEWSADPALPLLVG